MSKRAFDIVASLLGLIALSPLLVIIGIAIKLNSPGPVVYRATRVGRDARHFKLYKFRTMVVHADAIGPGITGAGDNRVTPVGRILRRTKLDELPQLINVLRGEMSLVGPRPEDPRYVAYYTDEQRKILNVRPGITSPASIAYRHETELLTGDDWETRYIEEVLPAKLAVDLAYARNPSVWQDVLVILRTFLVLFD